MVAAPSRPEIADPWTAALLDAFQAPAEGTGSAPDSSPSSADAIPASLRRQARLALAGRSLPSRSVEAWRFTDPRPLTVIPPEPLHSTPPSATPAPPSDAGAPPSDATPLRLLLNGRGDPLGSNQLPEGLERLDAAAVATHLGAPLATTGCAEDWPVLLNQACAERLFALRVHGAVTPLVELHSDPGRSEGLLPLRILLVMEEEASLDLLQVHRAAGASLTSVVVEVVMAPGARLRHGLVGEGSDDAVLLAHLAVLQAPQSELNLTSATSGWGLSRLEPVVVQTAGAAFTRLRGLQLVEAHQTADTHSRVRFDGPDGRLDQLHKSVADGRGHSIFNGAVGVPRIAQRTDAAQLSRNLLLSRRARVDTKPELEIVADDVKCAHGATVSRLQEDELFYLRSRGIGADQAARLLLRGFCDEVLRELPAGLIPAGLTSVQALSGEDDR
jgi:FeS assembly protein SufD